MRGLVCAGGVGGPEQCLLWKCFVRVVAVVVCINRRALQIGRHEARDDGTKLVKSFGAVQE